MGATQPLAPSLRALAARCLGIAPEALDPAAPLTRYGLDSLNAIELSVAISEATGIVLDEEVLLDAPSIDALAAHLLRSGPAHDPLADDPLARRLARMHADARLPDDVEPLRALPGSSPTVLLTGATGFLGTHLLAALLARGAAEVVCPVRASDDAAARLRVHASLERYGVETTGMDRGVRALAADICAPDLGLPPERYAALVENVGAVYHCAAEVNWALPYEALHAVNVGATLGLLRFACRGLRKDFHFVSSVAACYSTRNPGPVAEEGPTPDPAGIHLGYGHSKWVAERLVEAAATRGLAASIYRPSLIAGASTSGLGNDDDFLARMLRGCIALGYAPELDWRMDACPVDFVAAAIAALAGPAEGAAHAIPADGGSGRPRQQGAPLRVVHLRNPLHARWTEAVLWMNLRGYPITLEPFDAWIARVEHATQAPSHPLHALRGFLLARPRGEGGRTLPQIYADAASARLDAVRSDAALARAGLACPRLGAALLERYFDAWVAAGVLPQVGRSRPSSRARGRADPNAALEHALRTHFDDPALRVTAVTRVDLGAEHSILGELASWRAGSALALHGLRLALVHGDGCCTNLELVVKPKPGDRVVLSVTEEVATLCDPALGAAFAAYADRSELAGGDRREIALYTGALRTGASHADAGDALARHVPKCYGVLQAEGVRALLLERIRDAELIDSVNQPAAWTPVRIEAALAGIAAIHAEWLEREPAVPALLGDGREKDQARSSSGKQKRGQARFSPKVATGRIGKGARFDFRGPALAVGTAGENRAWPLSLFPAADTAQAWRLALARHARPWFERWLGPAGAWAHLRLAESAPEPAEPAAHPRTLIHNDFNPRNIALRRSGQGVSLCAFDWELATFGLPQRDLAELLCFVLPPDVAAATIHHYAQVHRRALERVSGRALPAAQWDDGLRLALAQFGTERLPMYCIAHRFRPQPFLERVTRSWQRLASVYGVVAARP